MLHASFIPFLSVSNPVHIAPSSARNSPHLRPRYEHVRVQKCAKVAHIVAHASQLVQSCAQSVGSGTADCTVVEIRAAKIRPAMRLTVPTVSHRVLDLSTVILSDDPSKSPFPSFAQKISNVLCALEKPYPFHFLSVASLAEN